MWTEAYLEDKINSASPIELVQLLYDGAIRFVRDAREYLETGDIARRSAAIGKAMAILGELTASLDHAKGGEISRNLLELYAYMQNRLLDANLHQTDGPLAETLGLLTTLAEAWHGIDASAGKKSTEVGEGNAQPGNSAWVAPPLEDQTVGTASYGWTL